MKDQAQAFGQRIWNEFRGFSSGQKAVTIAAVLALAIGGYLFATWKSKPTYAPLYTNLAAADASAIVDKLNSAGTPYELGAAGTEILVPSDKVYSARLAISAAGLPSSSQTGFPLLDKQGVTASQFQQQIAYQSDLENQLDRTIDAMSGVQSAAVTLAIPQQTVFTDTTDKPTAAVLLTVAPGTTLTTSQVQSVVYLVSSSVPSMSADSVTVTDSNGDVLSAPGQGVSSATTSASQAQATAASNTQLTTQIQNLLTAALGPGNAQVSVNSVLNFDQTSSTTKNYTYNKNTPPVSQSSTSETYTGTGSPPSGTLGASGSTASTDTTSGSTSGKGTYANTSNTVNNALGTQETDTTTAPGGIEQLHIAVEVNKAAPNVDVNAIESMVKSAVGYNATRGDTLDVSEVTFNTASQNAAKAATAAATKAAAAQASQSKLTSMIKQGLLGLLIAGLAFVAWRGSRKRRKRSGGEEYDDAFDSGLLPYGPGGQDEPVGPPQEQLNRGATNDPTAGRQSLVTNADNRPEDFARALSGWLNNREN